MPGISAPASYHHSPVPSHFTQSTLTSADFQWQFVGTRPLVVTALTAGPWIQSHPALPSLAASLALSWDTETKLALRPLPPFEVQPEMVAGQRPKEPQSCVLELLEEAPRLRLGTFSKGGY